MSSELPATRSNRRLWIMGVGLAVLGGLSFGLYRSVMHVRVSAAQAS